MNKALLSVISVAAVGLLGWGGMMLNHSMECRSLEEDYLNSVDGAKQAILVKRLAPESQPMADLSAGLGEGEMQRAEALLPTIYEECGERAGATAFRKGSSILLGP